MSRDTAGERCRYGLSIVSIFQDEAPYLREWIEFHKMMGVQHFVLIDDRSTDDFLDVLRPYRQAGEVELLRRACPPELQVRSWRNFQCQVLREQCARLRGVSRWVALIDADEFIVPASGENLPDYLKEHEDCGAVYIRWEPFGTAYVSRLARDELMTERLCRKWRFITGHDMLGKSIVKPHRVLEANIHQSRLLPGYRCADSNPGMRSEHARIQLNHYWTRDEHYLLRTKLPRAARAKGWTIDAAKVEFYRHAFNDVLDDSMTRFIPELRRRLFPPAIVAPP
jgi:hypothetical protein